MVQILVLLTCNLCFGQPGKYTTPEQSNVKCFRRAQTWHVMFGEQIWPAKGNQRLPQQVGLLGCGASNMTQRFSSWRPFKPPKKGCPPKEDEPPTSCFDHLSCLGAALQLNSFDVWSWTCPRSSNKELRIREPFFSVVYFSQKKGGNRAPSWDTWCPKNPSESWFRVSVDALARLQVQQNHKHKSWGNER